jgi:hypothetical protein
VRLTRARSLSRSYCCSDMGTPGAGAARGLSIWASSDSSGTYAGFIGAPGSATPAFGFPPVLLAGRFEPELGDIDSTQTFLKGLSRGIARPQDPAVWRDGRSQPRGELDGLAAPSRCAARAPRRRVSRASIANQVARNAKHSSVKLWNL